MHTNHESGLSLIEMLVAVAILAVAVLGIQRFTSNFSASQATQESRDYATATNKRILQFVQRDFKYRFNQNSYQIQNASQRLLIERRQQYDPNDSNARYMVSFETLCTPTANLPTETRQTLAAIYSNANRTFLQANGRCFQAASCGRDTYPQVRIRTNQTGARIPNYSPNLMPDFLANQGQRAGLQKGIVGSAICAFQQAGTTRLRVLINTAFIRSRQTQNNQEEFVLDLVSEETILTEGNVAGNQLQVLPD